MLKHQPQNSLLTAARLNSLLRDATFVVFLLSLFLSFTLSVKTSAQAAEDPFAVLVDIGHACSGSLGFAEFALTGDPSHYLYYWEHGETGLRAEGLSPGEYVFVVEDVHGCVQRFPVEIYLVDGCTAGYEIQYGTKPCYAWIVVQVFSGNNPIQEEALEVTWSDGYAGGLVRGVAVQQYTDQVFGVHIEMVNEDGMACCQQDLSILVPANPACDRKSRSPVIVNEFNRKEDGTGQYVELLVIGNGMCGDTFDLRGYILDDNNGELVRSDALIYADSIALLGIDEGFLFFMWDSVWAQVPNGSLIVIYDSEGAGSINLPPDDPEDGDGDGVYVLPADSPLLFGKSSFWDVSAQEMKYEGSYLQPSWDFVSLSAPADGLQVRYPAGEYCHGISTGQPVVGGLAVASSQNAFYLYLDSISVSDRHCSFTGPDYSVKADFSCDASSAGTQTPGQANSDMNAAFIYELQNCDPLLFFTQQGGSAIAPYSGRTNDFSCHPNPAKGDLEISCSSIYEGSVEFALRAMNGQVLDQFEIIVIDKTSDFLYSIPADIPSGVYLLEGRFLDGSRGMVRIVLIR